MYSSALTQDVFLRCTHHHVRPTRPLSGPSNCPSRPPRNSTAAVTQAAPGPAPTSGSRTSHSYDGSLQHRGSTPVAACTTLSSRRKAPVSAPPCTAAGARCRPLGRKPPSPPIPTQRRQHMCRAADTSFLGSQAGHARQGTMRTSQHHRQPSPLLQPLTPPGVAYWHAAAGHSMRQCRRSPPGRAPCSKSR